jgi:pyruvate dehydrogenase (quinone)
LNHEGRALLDVVTDRDAVEVPSDVPVAKAKALGKMVLGGGVGEALHLAKANFRTLPRP